MSTLTPNIGLKKPEGTDPFLTEDFDHNYDLIDSAIKALQDSVAAGTGGTGGTGGTTGPIDAATLQSHPASYFYSAANPPPGTGGTSTDDHSVLAWQFGHNLNMGLSNNATSPSVSLQRCVVPTGTFRIIVTCYAEFFLPANVAQTIRLDGQIDGSNANISTLASLIGVPIANTAGNWYVNATHVFTATVSGGNHLAAITATVGAGASAYVTFRHVKGYVMLASDGMTY